MVKIRLSRLGTKGRPFYRVVVAEAATGRNGKFVDTLGVYDPVARPKRLEVDEAKAIQWLERGAQPTETAAVVLNRLGILEKFLADRPARRKEFAFLDKRTKVTSVESVVDAPAIADSAE